MVIGQGSLKGLGPCGAISRLLHVAVSRSQSHVRRPWSYGPAFLLISWPCGQLRDRPRHPRLRTALQEPPMTEPTPLSSLSSALADVVSRTAPSVVAVHSHRSRATGFVWKPGLIVTADEALADEGDVEIGLSDGSTAAATIAGRDHTTDIALLRVDTAITPVKLATIVPPL